MKLIFKQGILSNLRPNQVLVLDNAAFHKGGSIAKILQQAHCKLLYLPPYSPDLNPIEHHWQAIKHKIKKIFSFQIMIFMQLLLLLLGVNK